MYNWKLFTLQLLSRHLIQRYLSLSSICKFNDISLFEYVKLKMFSISHTFRAWNKHCYQCLKWQNKQLFWWLCLSTSSKKFKHFWYFSTLAISFSVIFFNLVRSELCFKSAIFTFLARGFFAAFWKCYSYDSFFL